MSAGNDLPTAPILMRINSMPFAANKRPQRCVTSAEAVEPKEVSRSSGLAHGRAGGPAARPHLWVSVLIISGKPIFARLNEPHDNGPSPPRLLRFQCRRVDPVVCIRCCVGVLSS